MKNRFFLKFLTVMIIECVVHFSCCL